MARISGFSRGSRLICRLENGRQTYSIVNAEELVREVEDCHLLRHVEGVPAAKGVVSQHLDPPVGNAHSVTFHDRVGGLLVEGLLVLVNDLPRLVGLRES